MESTEQKSGLTPLQEKMLELPVICLYCRHPIFIDPRPRHGGARRRDGWSEVDAEKFCGAQCKNDFHRLPTLEQASASLSADLAFRAGNVLDGLPEFGDESPAVRRAMMVGILTLVERRRKEIKAATAKPRKRAAAPSKGNGTD